MEKTLDYIVKALIGLIVYFTHNINQKLDYIQDQVTENKIEIKQLQNDVRSIRKNITSIKFDERDSTYKFREQTRQVW